MRMKRVAFALAGLGVVCTVALALLLHDRHETHSPVVPVVEHPWNVIGTVQRVDFGPGYAIGPKSITMSVQPEINAPDTVGRRFTVGPERIHLVGGRVLRVPPRTPGANACLALMTDADKLAVTGLGPPDGLTDANVRDYGPRNLSCVIVAEVDRHDNVTRFSVLNTSDATVAHKGLAGVGALVGRAGPRFLTESGYAFRLVPHPKGDCAPDKVSVSHLFSDRPNDALVDPERGVIVEVDCLYRM